MGGPELLVALAIGVIFGAGFAIGRITAPKGTTIVVPSTGTPITITVRSPDA